QDFYHLLEHYHEETGATVLMVTHDWAAAFHHATHVLLLKSEQLGFGDPETVLAEENMRLAFGHVGHRHAHKRSEWVRA
ncbi:MAG: hypothetical protein JXO22_00195, partial [Phycisphaerae bacterium]|nr:hypothetical protein [Phycisphaerae bacterium]